MNFYVYDGPPGRGGTLWPLEHVAPSLEGLGGDLAIFVVEQFVYATIEEAAADYNDGDEVTYVIHDDGTHFHRRTITVGGVSDDEVPEAFEAAISVADPHYEDWGIGGYECRGSVGRDVRWEFSCGDITVTLPIPPPEVWVWEADVDEDRRPLKQRAGRRLVQKLELSRSTITRNEDGSYTALYVATAT